MTTNSERRFFDFIETATDWFWETDENHRFIFINGQTQRFIGDSFDNVLGKTRWEVFDVDIANDQNWRAHRDDLEAHRPFKNFEFHYDYPDGSRIYRNISGVPVFDAQGTFQGYRGTSRDVTEQRHAALALKASEQRYRELIEGSIQGIVIHRDARPLFANTAAAELFGYADGAKILRLESIADLFAPDEVERVKAYREARVRGQSAPSHYEFKGRRVDGSIVWLENRVRVIEWEGKPAIQLTMADITAQKNAEQALRDSEERYRVLSDLTSEGVSIHEDGIIVEANQAFADMYGYSVAELIGKPILELTVPEHRQDVANRMARNDVDTYESVSFRKDGSRLPIEIKATPIVYKGRHMRASRMRDLTEIKQTSRELARREASLAEAQRIGNMGNWERNVATGEVRWSDQVYRIFGLAPDQPPPPSRERYFAIIHEDDRARVRATVDAAIETGTPYSLDHRIVRPDGEVRIVHQEAELIYDSEGEPSHLVGTVQDITERKRAEQALQASEARLSGILDIAPDAIITADEHGFIRLFNQSAQNTFGYREDEVLGHSLDLLMPARFRAHHAENIAAFKAAGSQVRRMKERGEIVALRKGGAEFPAEASVSRLEIGDEIFFNVILRDVTERKRIEDEIIQAREFAEAANSTKSEFLANMSHELRTPMNAILGFSEIMAKESFGPLGNAKYKEYAEDIHVSGNHLLDLIGDVLDLSKIEAGALDLAEDEVDLDALLRFVLRMVRDRAARKSLRIETDLDPSVPHIRGDERAIKQIVLNLLTNSTKFTAAGGVIRVTSRIEPDGVVSLAVMDTGVGIAADDIPRVFQPFEQIGGAQTRAHDGTGLGLPIAKRLAELHAATFELESEVGVGTTVTIRFPPERAIRAKAG